MSEEESTTNEVEGERPGTGAFGSLSAGVQTAIIGAVSALLGAAVAGLFGMNSDRHKSDTELAIQKLQVTSQIDLEKEKEAAAETLATHEFETKLIIQATQNVTQENATRNLQFFLAAGFITDPKGKIAQLAIAAPPSTPSPNAPDVSSLPLTNPRACSDFSEENFKSAAKPLTAADVQEVAGELGIESAALQAVIDVESEPGTSDGRPALLFERQTFSRLTGGMYDSKYPDISSPTPGGYGPLSSQYSRLKKAMALDCGKALAASSWGMFQLMGMNAQMTGFKTVDQFVGSQMASGRGQLEALAKFMMSNPQLIGALRSKDWVTFARRYNGPNEASSGYDAKLAAAYQKYANAR